jgi:peptidoglycan DL-endopeptidase CwlO
VSAALVTARPSTPVGKTVRRVMLIASLAASVIVGALPGPVAGGTSWLASGIPPMAAEEGSEAWKLLTKAEKQIRDKWKFSAIGPDRFDCSGLVFFSFRETGLLDRIGNKRRGATAYKNWFTNQGQRIGPNIENARAGDLLVWGHGKHIGMYVGDGWAISTLVNPYGVRIHRYDRINAKLTDILKVKMSRKADGSDEPDPTPSPEPSPSLEPSPSPSLPLP